MIVDQPDNVAAASAPLTAAASGAGHWRPTPLFTAEAMDRAAQSAGHDHAPGG
jgi:hypothetical protein